ncbi:hypothetical protein BY996DRAFT_7328595 [Phakopsora pachyrhizi]|nr:hypothetical protein BY996DRAFT_7328595 [Phakopsora pachyrhizi]
MSLNEYNLIRKYGSESRSKSSPLKVITISSPFLGPNKLFSSQERNEFQDLLFEIRAKENVIDLATEEDFEVLEHQVDVNPAVKGEQQKEKNERRKYMSVSSLGSFLKNVQLWDEDSDQKLKNKDGSKAQMIKRRLKKVHNQSGRIGKKANKKQNGQSREKNLWKSDEVELDEIKIEFNPIAQRGKFIFELSYKCEK